MWGFVPKHVDVFFVFRQTATGDGVGGRRKRTEYSSDSVINLYGGMGRKTGRAGEKKEGRKEEDSMDAHVQQGRMGRQLPLPACHHARSTPACLPAMP